MDLARELPSATLDGFDIDISQSPPPQWLPASVQVHTLDAFSDTLPTELVGKYDVVHIAIFATIVKNNDPGSILRNLHKMLSKISSTFLTCIGLKA